VIIVSGIFTPGHRVCGGALRCEPAVFSERVDRPDAVSSLLVLAIR